jgi:hypothetical protein
MFPACRLQTLYYITADLNMSGNGGASKGPSNPMSPADASRIQSGAAKSGDAGKGSFASRAQSAGARNANAGFVSSKGGKGSK